MNPSVVAAVVARSGGRCEWCAYRGAPDGRSLQLHHVTPKGMGGRRRAHEASDSPDNLLRLCVVCHAAAHRERVRMLDGHACATCYLRSRCPHSVAPEPVLRSHGA